MRSTLWLFSLDLEAFWSDYGGGEGDLELIQHDDEILYELFKWTSMSEEG